MQAEALVGRVRQLVNVKDSFTRMNIEREKERRQRQEQHDKAIREKQKKAADQTELRDALYELFADSDAVKRGKQLESALNKQFAMAGFLVRKVFAIKGDEGKGIVEQIDGVVELGGMHYLVEMKWWQELSVEGKSRRTWSASSTVEASEGFSSPIRVFRPQRSKTRRRASLKKCSCSVSSKRLFECSIAKETWRLSSKRRSIGPRQTAIRSLGHRTSFRIVSFSTHVCRTT